MAVWKNEEFSHQKIFREINSLVKRYFHEILVKKVCLCKFRTQYSATYLESFFETNAR